MQIGVLALQGAFVAHKRCLESLGCKVCEVRSPLDLEEIEGLVIPGGESTTIYRQMVEEDLLSAISVFAKKRAVFGTCAGLILMSRTICPVSRVKPLNLLSISVKRNAFGRQTSSFISTIDLKWAQKEQRQFSGIFIRAPKIDSIAPSVEVLGTLSNGFEQPVLVRQGIHLGASFHPELTECMEIHQYFLTLVKNLESKKVIR